MCITIRRTYQAMEIASGPVTSGEGWSEVPEGTVFEVGEDYRLGMAPLLQRG